jgi:hypothetical protein
MKPSLGGIANEKEKPTKKLGFAKLNLPRQFSVP